MNRRSFLSFLSAAPVALPMAAKAVADRSTFASGGLVNLRRRPLVFGEIKGYVPSDNAALLACFKNTTDALQEAERFLALNGSKTMSVEAQMREHDLFENDDAQVKATTESQSPVIA